MNENYFQNLPSRTKLNDLTLAPIIVDSVSYNFTDYIENEYVSDFPTYSQRVRTIAKNVATTVDSYLTETDEKLKQMELAIKGNMDAFRDRKQQDYNEWAQARQQDYNSWINTKQGELTTKLNNIDTRITQFDNLRQGTEATDTNLGFITLNKVRELAQASMNENRVREIALNKMREFGIGGNSVSGMNINDYKPFGLYGVNDGSSRINGKSTAIINWQYDNDLGVQLGITEEDNPKLYTRAKRGGRWTTWEEIPKQSKVLELIRTNAPTPIYATQTEIDNLMASGIASLR